MIDGWESGNAYRRYPFADDAAMTVGAVSLPQDAILDASVTVPVGPVTLTGISTDGDGVTFSFTHAGGSFDVVADTTALPAIVYGSSGVAAFAFTFGIGCIELLGVTVTGTGPALAASAVSTVVTPRVDSVAAEAAVMTGDVAVTDGYNCIAVAKEGLLRFVTLAGIGLSIYCPDDPPPAYVTRFGGAGASAGGDVGLIGGPGIEITPLKDEHKIIVRVSRQAAMMFNCGGS